MRLISIGNDVVELPPELVKVADAQPAFIDRKDGADLVTEHVFPTTAKTIKSWPLPWECPNGRAQRPTGPPDQVPCLQRSDRRA